MDINPIDVAIGAAIMPPVIALINQARWPSQLKGLVALLLCALEAMIVLWLRDLLDWTNWRNTVLVVMGAALTAYHFWWRPTGIAPAIEAATSAGGPTSGTNERTL